MTTQKILIGDRTKDDAAFITEVTAAAFEPLEISNHTRQFIINALPASNALKISLLADMDGQNVSIKLFEF